MPLWEHELKNAYIGYPCLNFTANTAGSTIALTKVGTPTAVTIEISTGNGNWSTYTFGDTITLTNIGDKVYFRNTSETDTGFSLATNNATDYYLFTISGSVAGSGDVSYLLNKNGTKTLSYGCFFKLFNNCGALTTPPDLPFTTLEPLCFMEMFSGCSSLTIAPQIVATTMGTMSCTNMFSGCGSLTTLPKLLPTTLGAYCYSVMFNGCSKIKLSTTQTGEYQTPYRIPYEGTGTNGAGSLNNMFGNTGGTFTGTPTINTTYYTSNTVI